MNSICLCSSHDKFFNSNNDQLIDTFFKWEQIVHTNFESPMPLTHTSIGWPRLHSIALNWLNYAYDTIWAVPMNRLHQFVLFQMNKYSINQCKLKKNMEITKKLPFSYFVFVVFSKENKEATTIKAKIEPINNALKLILSIHNFDDCEMNESQFFNTHVEKWMREYHYDY